MVGINSDTSAALMMARVSDYATSSRTIGLHMSTSVYSNTCVNWLYQLRPPGAINYTQHSITKLACRNTAKSASDAKKASENDGGRMITIRKAKAG